jgi:hypothetical protein
MSKKQKKTMPKRQYEVGIIERRPVVITVTTTSRAKALQLAKAGFGDARPAQKHPKRRTFIKRVA